MLTKFMKFQLTLAVCLAISCTSSLTSATDADAEKVEESTVSPIAGMAMNESQMKTSTEKPLTMESMVKQEDEKPDSQRHTVADFIIHPLIAFKPRNPEEEAASVPLAGKQATTSTSSTTPSPWQLFGFTAGQGLGSSVSSLAGSVTGWINDRIQLPGLMETPVRESTTTSTSTTTTTTPRPDVVVRVQHKPTTRRPLISIDNRNRPNRPNFDSNENDDEEYFEENEDNDENENENENENEDNESSNEEGDSEGSNEREGNDNSEEEEGNEEAEEGEDGEEETEENSDDDEGENYSQRPNNRRRPLRNKNNQRRGNRPQNVRRRIPNRRQRPIAAPARRRPVNNNIESYEDVYNDDEDYNDNNAFFYGNERPSTKRSQSNSNFIQRGQQQLINQIRQLTRGQSPAEIGSAIRRAQTSTSPNTRRQQATLFVNRNGQTIYVAPELAQFDQPQFQSVYSQPIAPVQKVSATTTNAFPQPPLTLPLKQKGQPVQYITIPWAQLGISPPNNVVSIAEGIQSQPLILNIPQSAINTMQSQSRPGQSKRKKKRPQLITADAVPLLAEASLMDIFKPPQIPPSRHGSGSVVKPVFEAAKPSLTKAMPLVQQRIRPGTIVEKAPSMLGDDKPDDTQNSSSSVEPQNNVHHLTGEKEFIFVGKDEEPGVDTQVKPVYGDARYVRLTGDSQFYDVLPRRRFTIRRGGRELTHSESENEPRIPVQVVSEPASSDSKTDEMLPMPMPIPTADKDISDFMAKPLTVPLAPAENVSEPRKTAAT